MDGNKLADGFGNIRDDSESWEIDETGRKFQGFKKNERISLRN